MYRSTELSTALWTNRLQLRRPNQYRMSSAWMTTLWSPAQTRNSSYIQQRLYRTGRDVVCIYNQYVAFFRDLRVTLEMIKWEHSIFALPFALCGAFLAAGGIPSLRQLGWIIVAMVAARSAAMAFNRLADASIDAANPRTQSRALPVGALSKEFVAVFVVASC